MTRILLPPVLARLWFGVSRAGRQRLVSGSANINGDISTPSWGSSLEAATAFGLFDVIYSDCLPQLSLRTCPLSRKLGISVNTPRRVVKPEAGLPVIKPWRLKVKQLVGRWVRTAIWYPWSLINSVNAHSCATDVPLQVDLRPRIL